MERVLAIAGLVTLLAAIIVLIRNSQKRASADARALDAFLEDEDLTVDDIANIITTDDTPPPSTWN